MQKGLAYRVFATALCFLLFYTSSAAGIHAAVTGVGGAMKGLAQGRAPFYSDAPIPIRVPEGGHRRDPKNRGGVWNDASLRLLENARRDWVKDPVMYASLAPAQTGGDAGGSEEGGEPYPWEGYTYVPGPGMSLLVNTNTGNLKTTEHITGWPSRGIDIDFSLYHNSESNYDLYAGKGWSHSFDILISNSSFGGTGQGAVLRWGDGTTVPYSYEATNNSIESYFSPTGFHDQLTKHLVQSGEHYYRLLTKEGTLYHFDRFGSTERYRCSYISDRAGNTIAMQFNGELITRVTCPTGRYLTLNYLGGNLSSVVSPDNRTWTFTLDDPNGEPLLERITFPFASLNNHKDFTYSLYGTAPFRTSTINSITDFAGNSWTYTYQQSQGKYRLWTSRTPGLRATTYSFGSGSTTVTSPEGKTLTHNYVSGKLTSEVDSAGYSTQYELDTDNNVTQLTDQRGKIWQFTYDTKGNVLTEKDPLNKTWTYTYSSQHDLLTARDPLNNQYTLTWDNEGNLLTVTDPLNRVVMTNTYGNYGDLLTSTNAESQTTTVDYDGNWNVDVVTDPTSRSLNITYDVVGRPLEVVNANNQITEISYDGNKRPYKVTHPDGSYSRVYFDFNDNVVEARNERGKSWLFEYDIDNRLKKTTNPKSEVEEYTLNNDGWVSAVKNGRNYSRTYLYTPRGEVSKLTMPDGSIEEWSYNGTGDVTLYKNGANGTGVVFEYDNAGRNTKINYPTNADTVFTYDNADRLTTMVDGTGTTTWNYNVASEVTSIASPQGTVHYTYHPSGRRATMRPGWLVNPYSYSYDAAGRLTTFGTPWSESVTFEYDNLGRENKRTFTGGHYEERTYDSRDRLSEIVLRNSAQSILRIQGYTYLNNNNVHSHYVDGVTTTYGYDDIDQLISETDTTGYSASYSYDANGNRTNRTVNGLSETYVYDSGDKLQSVTWSGGYKNYTYDAAGNTKTVATAAGTTTLNYDEEGRLTGIVYPSTSTNAFTYNGFRARRSITDSAGTRSYVRDGQDAASNLVTNGQGFSFPGGLGEHRGTATFWHHGGVKNVDGRTDTSGAMLATKRYDAFGNQKATSGWMPTLEKYGGKYGYQIDSESALSMLGNRYFDSNTGRSISRDPVKDGRNWFSYCANSPVQHADPTGLCYWCARNAEGLGAEAAMTAPRTIANPFSGVSAWFNNLMVRLGWRNASLAAGASTAAGNAALNAGGPRGMSTGQAGMNAGQQFSLNAARYGQAVHKEVQRAYEQLGQGWRSEVGLGSAGRADLVNVAQRRVIEIKPENPDKMWSYIRQLERYVKELERIHGGKWEYELLTYPKYTGGNVLRYNRKL